MESPEPAKAPEPEPESEESDVELDMTGVVEPDNDENLDMGDPNKELSDADLEKFDEKRSEAMGVFSEGEWEKAVGIFTEAIKLNAGSAMPFVKRAQCLLKLAKPNACIRDCNRAIEINPDNAAAHKYRGRAHRLLGDFLEAAKDLRLACKIDFDDQADEWLREVTPNAKKIEDHERKKQRKRAEKEIAEKKERIRAAQEAREKAAKEAENAPPSGGAPSGDDPMGGLGSLFNDPELMEALSDPEVAQAFSEITQNPANLMKYQGNPKVMKLITKMASKMGGGMPPGGMPPNMGGNPPPASGGKPPSATDDLD